MDTLFFITLIGRKNMIAATNKTFLLEISIPFRVMVFRSSKNLALLNLLKTKGFWGAKKTTTVPLALMSH
jgi:hypothetical protein